MDQTKRDKEIIPLEKGKRGLKGMNGCICLPILNTKTKMIEH
jgi:hypothetical protein